MAPLRAQLVLCLVALSQAQLFPVGQDLVYSYTGLIQNTVEKPTPFTSQYSLNAQLHIKGYENGCQITLRDIKHDTYVGKYKTSNLDGMDMNEIPMEAQCMSLPFYVEYGFDGKVKDVLTNTQDETWCVNIKQAIASLMQLDYLQIDLTKNEPYSFYSDEQCVYGHCKLQYDVMPHNKTTSTIKKWLTSCKDTKWETNFNILTPGHCDEKFKNSLQTTMYRTYDVEYTNKIFIIKKMVSDGSVMYYPINGNGGAHSVNVQQTMTMMSSKLGTSSPINTNELVRNGVKAPLYKFDNVVGSPPDATLGRSKLNMETAMTTMRENLKEMVNHMKSSQVSLSEPNWKQTHLFYNILNNLRLYNIRNLEHCYDIISNVITFEDKERFNMFMEMLPYVGTHASALLMKNLISERKLEDVISMKLLQEMPFHLYPSKDTLDELSELVQLNENVKKNVRDAGVLCFSNFLSKVLKRHPNSPDVITHVDQMLEKFVSCKDYPCQVLYISALQNIQSSKIVKFMEPLIMNQKTNIHKVTSHLRNLAMWVAKGEHQKYPELANKIYWPILMNKEEPLEIRASALNILLANPNLHNLLKIFWYMKTVEDKHLYSIFYTSLKSMAGSVSNCHHTWAEYAKRVLQYMRNTKAYNVNSGVYQNDYYDPESNMGAVLRYSMIGNIITHQSMAFYMQFSSHLSNMMINLQATYVKTSISKHLRDLLLSRMKTNKSWNEMLPWLMTELESLEISPNDLSVEYITLKGHHIIAVECYNDLISLMNIVKKIIDTQKLNTSKFSIEEKVLGNVLLPTDFGMPLSIYVSLPTIQKMKLYWKFDESSLSVMDVKFQMEVFQWNPQVYGMTVYNPIKNMWHGSRRFLTVDYHIPLSVEMTVNLQLKTLKMSFNTLKDKYDDSTDLGFQSYVQTQVYTFDGNTNTYDCIEKVTNGVEYRKKNVIFDYDHESTGLNYKMVIFDCERSVDPQTLIQLQQQFIKTLNQNTEEKTLMRTLLTLRHLWAHITLSAHPGMCGFGMKVVPSKIYPATHADLSLRLVPDEQTSSTPMVPVYKWNFRSTLNLKNGDDLMKTMDTNIITIVKGMYISEMDINYTIMKPQESNYKMCINVQQSNMDEMVDGKCTILAGDSTDNKCPQDMAKIEIDMEAKLSNQQMNSMMKGMYSNPQCHSYNEEHPLPCTLEQTSLRDVYYNITYTNIPKHLTDIFMTFDDWLRTHYGYHFDRNCEEKHMLNDGLMKLYLNYPVMSDDVNVLIQKPTECYRYQGLPLTNWYWTGMVLPYSTHISLSTLLKHHLGMSHNCEIGLDYYVTQFKEHKAHTLSDMWTTYASSNEMNPKWKIMVKGGEKETLALRLMVNDDYMDLYYQDGAFTYNMNGEKVQSLQHGYHTNSLCQMRLLNQEHLLMLYVPNIGLNVNFDGSQITAQIPRGFTNKGLCYDMPL